MRIIIAVLVSMLLSAPAEKPVLVYMAGAGERGPAVEEQRETLEALFPGYGVVIPGKTTEQYDVAATAAAINGMGRVDVLVGFSQGAIGACRVYTQLAEKPREVWLLGASAGVTDRQARLYADAVSPETVTWIIMGRNERPERQARGRRDAEIMGASYESPRQVGHDAGRLLREMAALRGGGVREYLGFGFGK